MRDERCSTLSNGFPHAAAVAAGMILLSLFAGGLRASGALPAPSAGVDDVQVTPAEPVQGDTLIVTVRAPAGDAVDIRFDGTPVPTFTAGEGVRRALAGTDPDVPAGRHAVAVTITRPGGPPIRTVRTVPLAAGRFGVRSLTLPPQTMGLITSKNLALEWQALGPVFSRRTPAAWWRGAFQAPSTGPISAPYGEQGFYNGHREWWHQGVDFAAPEGAPVTAPNAGIVVLARALPLGGNTVVIDHGQGVLSECLHLSTFAVAVGDRVEKGTVIGRLGATGLTTGPNVHWGLYVLGIPVNPLFWLQPRAGLTSEPNIR